MNLSLCSFDNKPNLNKSYYSKTTNTKVWYEEKTVRGAYHLGLFEAIDKQNVAKITVLAGEIKNIRFYVGDNAEERMSPLRFAQLRNSSDLILEIISKAGSSASLNKCVNDRDDKQPKKSTE